MLDTTGKLGGLAGLPGGITGRHFEDPSEPIYTDPSLFERSRSLRSIAVLQEEHNIPKDS